VDKLSGGRLAYIWLPNTATPGYTSFIRYFYSQQDKEGTVVDERYNQGGNVWNFMPKIMGSYGTPDSGGRRFLFFPRTFVLPNGNLFFATPMPAEFTDSTEGNFFSTGKIAIHVGAHTYEIEVRGVEKTQHIHNVILHYAAR